MKRLMLIGTIFGSILIVLGLVTIGSTIGQSESTEMRLIGMMLASFGALIVAFFLYLSARSREKKKKSAANQQNDARMRCFICGSPQSIVRCEKHMVRLCADCISKHDEGSQCFYIPLSRFMKASSARSTT